MLSIALDTAVLTDHALHDIKMRSNTGLVQNTLLITHLATPELPHIQHTISTSRSQEPERLIMEVVYEQHETSSAWPAYNKHGQHTYNVVRE
jgi:hypothetical protein